MRFTISAAAVAMMAAMNNGVSAQEASQSAVESTALAPTQAVAQVIPQPIINVVTRTVGDVAPQLNSFINQLRTESPGAFQSLTAQIGTNSIPDDFDINIFTRFLSALPSSVQIASITEAAGSAASNLVRPTFGEDTMTGILARSTNIGSSGTDASATGTATGTDASATGTATGTDASATGTDASATGTDVSATGTETTGAETSATGTESMSESKSGTSSAKSSTTSSKSTSGSASASASSGAASNFAATSFAASAILAIVIGAFSLV
ncbi:hypothetical protein AYI70_g2017 [Smittium culicis]|uniref:Uncharacterized protein n=1 Tax=Smittium culicis TaxID=133412 RepID=A0A1R1X1Y3_9FUNG|nr:hypothetical protein AYI70_g11418 [Smittium culicis]OMJ23790.1 hypothetical protein AYI70_g2017 [Smittium culicis]